MEKLVLAAAMVLAGPAAMLAQDVGQSGPARWTSNGAPSTTPITGGRGRWTLERSGAAKRLEIGWVWVLRR